MTSILRRTPDVIVAAHELDPQRIELFVEGSTDRSFIEWLTDPVRSPDALVRQMATVEFEQTDGGERGRLIAFASQIEGFGGRIRFFADADWDRLLGITPPTNVWLTDHRDMEAYFLRVECLDKILRVGIGTEVVAALDLLQDVQRIGRRLGLLRLLSTREGRGFAFQATNLWRHLKASKGRVTLDEQSFLRSLLQNSGISLTGLDQVAVDLDGIQAELENVDDTEVIHGKDALTILAKAFSCFGIRKEDGAFLVRTSFERALVADDSALDQLATYLNTGWAP